MEGGPEPFLFSLIHSRFHSPHPRDNSVGWSPIPEPSTGFPPSPGLAGSVGRGRGSPRKMFPKEPGPLEHAPPQPPGCPAQLREGRKEGRRGLAG